MPRHIKVKLIKSKDKEKILKIARDKRNIHTENKDKNYNRYFIRNYASSKNWNYIFKI